MSSRGHRASTTPMDFEWSNQSGPMDPTSPWLAGQSAKKREHFDFAPVPESPARRGYTTPSRARDAEHRGFFFSPEKPLSSLPAHVQNAWEPRTPASNYDASSGGETPTTPQMDSDAATPDTHTAARGGRLGPGEASSKKGPRPSWFKRAFLSSPSPTKEQKEPRESRHTRKTDNRITKRRPSEKSERSRSKKRRARAADDDDDDDDEDGAPVAPAAQGAVKQTFAMSIAGVLSWIEAHPHLPSVLSYYLQLFVNTVLGLAFLYIVYSAWHGIITDVEIESTKHAADVMAEIARCAHEYNVNRCRPDDVVPAMQNACRVWETCMNRDPKRTARASVTAKTFAMIFNSFVEEFSYKSMIFTFLLLFGGFNLSNWAFGLLRAAAPQARAHPPNPNDFIPQTPHRVLSNNYIEYSQQPLGYGQSWQHQQQQQQQHPGQGANTPYRIEAPPPLVHTQSMPQLPTASLTEAVSVEERRSPRKKGLFR